VEEVELRCDNGIKFGELFPEETILEVKCRSARCGAAHGVIVIHSFDLGTGKLVGTETFRDPAKIDEEG
jgi:hypothetical protein